jgi:hypothetical protein
MEKINILSRRIALFFDKYGIITESISGVLLLISGYFQFGASFSSSTPSVFYGANVNSFFMANISLIIFIVSVIVTIGGGILWAITKNAPPLVDVKEYSPNGTGQASYIKLKNNEPSELVNVYIKILKFTDMRRPSFEFTKSMGSYNIIKVKENIVKGQEVEIPFVEGNDGELHILTDGKKCIIPVLYKELKEFEQKYDVVMEIMTQPSNEKYSMLVGKYQGTILHHRWSGVEVSDKHISGVIYQDWAVWEKDSFKKLSKKEYRSLIQKGLVLQL